MKIVTKSGKIKKRKEQELIYFKCRKKEKNMFTKIIT